MNKLTLLKPLVSVVTNSHPLTVHKSVSLHMHANLLRRQKSLLMHFISSLIASNLHDETICSTKVGQLYTTVHTMLQLCEQLSLQPELFAGFRLFQVMLKLMLLYGWLLQTTRTSTEVKLLNWPSVPIWYWIITWNLSQSQTINVTVPQLKISRKCLSLGGKCKASTVLLWETLTE